MGKEFVLSFVLFLLVFDLRVTFFWGNFATCFFKSNDKWEDLFNTFLFHYFFTQAIFFSCTTTYDIPFLQIHTTNYFLLS